LPCSTLYDAKIEIWAAGCVVAEILLDAIPMFQGESNADHLTQIMRIIGRPTWDDENSFEHELPFPDVEQICSIELALPLSTDPDLLNLLKRIFVYNPHKRPSAEECMRSASFDELFRGDVVLPSGEPLPELPRP
jgi:serine/threonine protein kinase